MVTLYGNNHEQHVLVHRLVAEAFLPDKSNFKSMPYEDRSLVDLGKLEVNHKDENKENNRVDNLEWCTRAYNNNYGNQSKNGRRKSSNKRMKKVSQFDKDGNFIKTYNGIRLAEEQTGINNRNICACCQGKTKTTGGYKWEYAKDE
jgi:hypothetical protein